MRDQLPLGRIPPGFFGMALGLAGLSALWLYVAGAFGVATAVGDALMLLTAVTWLVLMIAYVRQGTRRILADARDAAAGPFLAAPVMSALVLGAALSRHAPEVGRVIVVVSLAAGVLLCGWLIGQWMTGGLDEQAVGPAFYLPGSGIAFVGSEAASTVGLHSVAALSFGIGALAWVLTTSTVLRRLCLRRRLAPALIPTLAIDAAPVAVAGNAYFLLHPGLPDVVAFALAGYAVTMVVAQVRLLPLYRALRYTPSFWAFTFPCAAMATFWLRWLAIEQPVGQRVYAWILIVATTCLVAAIAARTIVAVARGDLLSPSAAAGD
ncbi:MAG: family transporter [Solirubrobacterales bacterium]|nr:family transporter [Solirubrobacterales bacterium]